MPGDQDLPNIRVGRDAENEDSGSGETSTVVYLNYAVLDDFGWSLDDDDLFEKAADADLEETDYGTFEVPEHRNVLDAAEDAGHEWPFECRAASCANCAGIVKSGEVDMEMDLILTDEEITEKNIVLTCQALAVTDEVELVYNAKHLDYLQDRVIGVREV